MAKDLRNRGIRTEPKNENELKEHPGYGEEMEAVEMIVDGEMHEAALEGNGGGSPLPPIAETPKKIPFDDLPDDHPIHRLARRIYDGESNFDAFHMIRSDGLHVVVDVQRCADVQAITGNNASWKQLRPWTKIQTGSLASMPELGRASDWYAKAALYSPNGYYGQEIEIKKYNDGNHSVLLRLWLYNRLRASIAAHNSEHLAAFSELLPEGTDPADALTPFPIDVKDLRQRYIKQEDTA